MLLRAERDRPEHRLLGAGIAELDVAELDDAELRAVRRRDHGQLRVVDRRLGLEDLADPTRRDRRPGHEDEQEDSGQRSEQDLQQVLQERRQIADRQLAGVDPRRAEPQDRDR